MKFFNYIENYRTNDICSIIIEGVWSNSSQTCVKRLDGPYPRRNPAEAACQEISPYDLSKRPIVNHVAVDELP